MTAKVTATTLPDEPHNVKQWRVWGNNKRAIEYIDALLQSFNAERLRAEAEVAQWKAYALHQEWCQRCAESLHDCREGKSLKQAAIDTAIEQGAQHG